MAPNRKPISGEAHPEVLALLESFQPQLPSGPVHSLASNSSVDQPRAPVSSEDHETRRPQVTLLETKYDPPGKDDKSNPQKAARFRSQKAARRGRAWARALQKFNDLWLFEIGSVLLSIAAISAVIWVLKTVDQQPLSRWTHSLQITTVISFLAIIAKSSLALVASTGLSQHKWNVYASGRRHRKLLDFHLLDGASRGPLGSFSLILSARRPDVAVLMAVVLVTAIATEPFVQQSVKFRGRNIASQLTALIPTASTYDAIQPGSTMGVPYPELPMMAAINSGIFDVDASATSNPLQADCASGNCTFPAYATLSVCSECVNVTQRMKKVCKPDPAFPSKTWCNYTLPNGLEATDQEAVYFNTSGSPNTELFNTKLPHLATFSSLGRAVYNDGATPMVAMDCMMYACVAIYRASVSEGLLSEELQTTLRLDTPKKNWVNELDISLDLPDSAYDTLRAGSPRKYTVEGRTHFALIEYLGEQLSGSVSQVDGAAESDSSSDTARALWDNGGGYQMFDRHNVTGFDIGKVIDNLALTMEHRIRQANPKTAQGITTDLVTYVEVDWAWLSLPFAIEALTMSTLLVVMMSTARRKVPVWKGHALAAMLHGLPLSEVSSEIDRQMAGEDDGTTTKKSTLETYHDMEAFAADVQVRLEKDRDAPNMMTMTRLTSSKGNR